MGTRLYPKTNNPSVLERLADVPAGTYNLYKKLKDEAKKRKAHLHSLSKKGYNVMRLFWLLDEEMWNRQQENPDVAALAQFLAFGWGKIQFDAEYCGEEDDPVKIDNLLWCQGADLNGVPVEELEGVYWS